MEGLTRTEPSVNFSVSTQESQLCNTLFSSTCSFRACYLAGELRVCTETIQNESIKTLRSLIRLPGFFYDFFLTHQALNTGNSDVHQQ